MSKLSKKEVEFLNLDEFSDPIDRSNLEEISDDLDVVITGLSDVDAHKKLLEAALIVREELDAFYSDGISPISIEDFDPLDKKYIEEVDNHLTLILFELRSQR